MLLEHVRLSNDRSTPGLFLCARPASASFQSSIGIVIGLFHRAPYSVGAGLFFFLSFFLFRFRRFHRWNVIVFHLGSRRWDFLRLSNEFPSGSFRRLWKEKKRTVVLETSSKLKFQLRAVVYVRLNLGQKMRKFSISVWSLLWARSSKNAEVLFRR